MTHPSATSPPLPPLDEVYAYHERTKHAFQRYAAGPGYLDWETQPNPFREFDGAPRIDLALASDRAAVAYSALFQPGQIPPAEPSLESLGLLFELSFGLSAWKSYGTDRWALRCNPSSGNLHPTEAYLITGSLPQLQGGVYHYRSYDHALEQRCAVDLNLEGCLVGLSSVHWREAWKYGERAFRYCQHDAGHAFGALSYAAAVLGWTARLLPEWGDEDLAALLGLERGEDFQGAEREAPDLVCWVGLPDSLGSALDIEPLTRSVRSGRWFGRANLLSSTHRQEWTAIDRIHAATLKPRTPSTEAAGETETPQANCRSEAAAAEIIRQRRSAQAFDGVTGIAATTLYRMLDATLPRAGVPPFAGWPWAPRVHLVLFVHRVQGLRPGLYVFLRGETDVARMRPIFKPEFEWLPVEHGTASFPLFRLMPADARQAAKLLSCQQDIAGDGAFSLGMLAEFDAGLREGPWVYRRLFWETGLIGQVLYLEAEASGVRGTGIGCFFDDPVHELLGLEGTRLQSLYHFTVGGPQVDNRLQTLPAYAHLPDSRRKPND